jgi:hypothetical protein|uniref:Uncharacterized protein n=1 Tax=viral metagenome TaxID=1070528 RepID=A0A6C0CY30_9ZZZZ
MDLSNSVVSENVIIDPSQNEIVRQKYIQQREEYINKVKVESVNMICRQTDYTEDEAREKLEKNNYNYQIVLNEYFGIKESPKKEQTTNQQIYGEIRNLMDTGARKFRQEQDRAKAYQEYIEKQKKTE